ncbi:MAG: hypothetical protein ACP6KW_06865 [Candidatus Thorarchaeota archaeon]
MCPARQDGEEQDTSDVESETKDLMEKALEKGDTIEGPKGHEEGSTSVQIDVTFQRLQGRMLDLFGSIEDSLKGVEPSLKAQVDTITESLTKQLSAAGLGVFSTRAVKIVKDELNTSLAPGDVFSPVYETIDECKASVEDIMTKAGRGAVRNVGQSAGTMQARLVQMYATLTEMDKKLETTRAELRKWRGRATELEERLRQMDDVMSSRAEEAAHLQEIIDSLTEQLKQKDDMISTLKGDIMQATSQIEQQKQIMASMDSLAEVASELDAKVVELSETKGQLAEKTERLTQKEAEVETLREQMAFAASEKGRLEGEIKSLSEELAGLKGSETDFRAEVEELRAHVAELQARWDTLYRVAENEPEFKAYFLVADKTQWFPLTHLASALGIPTVLLKRNLQKFVDVGLLEIEEDRVRPRSLSDLVKDAEGLDAQMIEEAKTEMGDEDPGPLDPKDLVMPTPEYTGPDEGSDYEQEGR